YDLTVEVQPESHTLVVDAIVQFRIVGEDKGWVRFDLNAQEIFSVRDQTREPLNFHQTQGLLYVEIPSLADKDALLEVAVSYDRVVIGGFGDRIWEQIDPEGTYVREYTGWYPLVKGDRATADFRFIVPEGETVVTCGAYQGEVVLADGRTAQAWSTDMPIASIGFACGKYVVSHVEGEDFDVQAYLYEEDADRAEEYLELCGEALTLYSDLFGPYPYAKFAVVEIPVGYGGGMGHQSFIMLFERGFKGEPDEIFWSHEISHNWWGHYVSVDRSFGSWLSEGMATYSSLLFFEHKYEKQVFLEKLHWAAEKYLIQAETSEMPLRYASDTIVAYYKGAYFFHMLRYVVGDEVFWGILRKLVAVHGGGGRIDPRIFQEVSEEEAGTDLDWFFTQWLDRTGAPRYEVAWE
ncbi:MAG: hypothetical protein KAQ78_09520, partial [Candidatus Latescibacteria bacterium]|nr:hypothetical protein [Candidatus Latescibacterota bacterium]